MTSGQVGLVWAQQDTSKEGATAGVPRHGSFAGSRSGELPTSSQVTLMSHACSLMSHANNKTGLSP